MLHDPGHGHGHASFCVSLGLYPLVVGHHGDLYAVCCACYPRSSLLLDDGDASVERSCRRIHHMAANGVIGVAGVVAESYQIQMKMVESNVVAVCTFGLYGDQGLGR